VGWKSLFSTGQKVTKNGLFYILKRQKVACFATSRFQWNPTQGWYGFRAWVMGTGAAWLNNNGWIPQTLDSSQIVVSLESNDDFTRVELFRGNAFQQFFALKGALDLWSLLPAAAGVLRTKGEAAKPSGRSGKCSVRYRFHILYPNSTQGVAKV